MGTRAQQVPYTHGCGWGGCHEKVPLREVSGISAGRLRYQEEAFWKQLHLQQEALKNNNQ